MEIFTPAPKKILEIFSLTYTDHPTKNFDQKIIFLEVIGIFKKTIGVLVGFYFHTLNRCFKDFFSCRLEDVRL